jgi:hypothetical protein
MTMGTKIGSFLLLITLTCLSISCQSSSNEVELLEINDNGIAIFTVKNTTDEDLTGIGVELVYMNADDEVIKVDTVHYNMADNATSPVFLEAGGQTTISQRAPENTTKASGKIISTTN